MTPAAGDGMVYASDVMLTESMIEGGRTLVEALERHGVSPTAALWFYFTEQQKWRLILAEENLAILGHKQLYRKIQELLDDDFEAIRGISLDDITLTRPDAPILNAWRIQVYGNPYVLVGGS